MLDLPKLLRTEIYCLGSLNTYNLYNKFLIYKLL